MSNDNAAARREARRRRILENSETRLSKITSCDKSGDSELAASIVNPFDRKGGDCNGTVQSTQNAEPNINLQRPDQEEAHDCVINDSVIVNESETSEENFVTEETPQNSDTVEDKSQIIIWTDCIFIICLSVLVRLMYEFNLSSLFAESMFVPFATISMAKLAANPSKHISKSVLYGGVVRVSLLLSGIPKIWIDRIFLCIQTCVDLGNDFALYFFSFTMTHIFLESFIVR